ncbi:MAG: hypothetical protein JJE16_15390 [Nitrospiraceae bacterium]|nr:hypothetical protein [Nitrospiraceae bacterium]
MNYLLLAKPASEVNARRMPIQERITRLLPALAVAVTLMGGPLAASVVLGQQKELGTKADQYPAFFKMYGKDGRDSLTASCTPIDLKPIVNQVTCKFIHVRFDLPGKRSGEIDMPLSVAEAVKTIPGLAEEVRKNPKKAEQEFIQGLETNKQLFCSSPSGRIEIETKMRDPEIGPKRKSYLQEMIAACSNKDPTVFWRRMLDLKWRTCGLYIDHFTLEFKKVREGQWLFRSERPGLLSKVLKVYELTGNGFQWTLSETRVPTEGAEETPTRTVWNWENVSEYELPCEFISHSGIQYQ